MRRSSRSGSLGRTLGCTLLLTLLASASRGVDVNFYSVYKSQKFNQTGVELPTLGGGDPYRIGAVVDPAVLGSILGVTVTPPIGPPQTVPFDPGEEWFVFEAKFATQASLDAAAPAGRYIFTVSTLHDGTRTLPLDLPVGTYPNAPHISNYAEAQTISPTGDFILRWDALTGGKTNDYVSLTIADLLTGALLLNTPGPLQTGSLNGLSTSQIIPAGTLQPNASYGVQLFFFRTLATDYTTYPGAPGLVGYAAFTDFIITTTVPASFGFSLRHLAQGGIFLNSTNATPSFPVAVNAYRAQFSVTNDLSVAPPAEVLFTGPAGSGLTNTPADPTTFSSVTAGAFYFSPRITQPHTAPAGNWLVNYKGGSHAFPKDPQVASRLVVPVPQVGLSNQVLTAVRWSYYDRNGNPLSGTPAVVTGIQVQVQDASGAFLYTSALLPPGTTSHLFTSPINSQVVNNLRFVYFDDLEDSFVINFPRISSTTPIELAALDHSSALGFTFSLSGEVGRGYLVQSSPDLVHWTNVVTTNLTAATVQLVDPQATNSGARFYRARLAN